MTDRAALLMDLADRVERAKADEQKAVLEDVLKALHLYSTVFRLLDNHAYLDAAMSLVPADHFWTLTMRGAEDGYDACCVGASAVLRWHHAATPALALCAAALRALASGAPR